MLTAELMNAVLNEPILEVVDTNTQYHDYIGGETFYNLIQYKTEFNTYYVNVYEFMHECKVWAHSKGYIINSRHDNTPNLWEAYININLLLSHSAIESTEYEAVINLCEWILQNKLKDKHEH